MSRATSEQPSDAVYPSEREIAAQLALVNAKIPVSVDPSKAANVASDGSIAPAAPQPGLTGHPIGAIRRARHRGHQ